MKPDENATDIAKQENGRTLLIDRYKEQALKKRLANSKMSFEETVRPL